MKTMIFNYGNIYQTLVVNLPILPYTGTLPLTRFFGTQKSRAKGKPRYRRIILVLKPQDGEYESSKSTF